MFPAQRVFSMSGDRTSGNWCTGEPLTRLESVEISALSKLCFCTLCCLLSPGLALAPIASDVRTMAELRHFLVMRNATGAPPRWSCLPRQT